MVEVRVSDIEQYCTKEFAKLSKCFDKTQDENKCKKSVTPLQECTKKFIDNVKFITTKCENPFYDYKYSIKKKESEEKTNPLFESLWECMKKIKKNKNSFCFFELQQQIRSKTFGSNNKIQF